MAGQIQAQPGANWTDAIIGYQKAIRAFDMGVAPILRKHGISKVAIGNILLLINIGDGPRRVIDLVNEHKTPGSNVSYVLNVLEDKGLITRHLDNRDKRVKIVEATSKGHKIITEIRELCGTDAQSVSRALSLVGKLESQMKPTVEAERVEAAE